MKQRVIVTCGPAIAPIDDVRAITNLSTGELGHLLSTGLVRAGFDVDCFCGQSAVMGACDATHRIFPFTTNQNLIEQLNSMEGRDSVTALFHVAALTDFEVARIENTDGEPVSGSKIPSRQDGLMLYLTPAVKVLPQLPSLFPNARVVGWKYEMEGNRSDAMAAAQRQLDECGTPACVINGAAFGPSFGFLDKSGRFDEFPDKPALVRFLAEWLGT